MSGASSVFAAAVVVTLLTKSLTVASYALNSTCSPPQSAGGTGYCGPSYCALAETTSPGCDFGPSEEWDYPGMIGNIGTIPCAQSTDPRCSAGAIHALVVGQGIKAAYCNDFYLVIHTDTTSGFPNYLDSIMNPPASTSVDGTPCVTRSANQDFRTFKIPLNPVKLSTSEPDVNNINSKAFPSASANTHGSHIRLNTGGKTTAIGLPARDPIGITVGGQIIYPSLNQRGHHVAQSCAVDTCNQHVDPSGGQPHLHGDPFGDWCLYSAANYTEGVAHPPQIGWALDGYDIHGRHLQESDIGYSAPLDDCGGHEHDNMAYHYHTQVIAATTDNRGMTPGLPYFTSTSGPYKCFKGDISNIPNFYSRSKGRNLLTYLPDPAAGFCSNSTDYYYAPGIVLPPMMPGLPDQDYISYGVYNDHTDEAVSANLLDNTMKKSAVEMTEDDINEYKSGDNNENENAENDNSLSMESNTKNTKNTNINNIKKSSIKKQLNNKFTQDRVNRSPTPPPTKYPVIQDSKKPSRPPTVRPSIIAFNSARPTNKKYKPSPRPTRNPTVSTNPTVSPTAKHTGHKRIRPSTIPTIKPSRKAMRPTKEPKENAYLMSKKILSENENENDKENENGDYEKSNNDIHSRLVPLDKSTQFNTIKTNINTNNNNNININKNILAMPSLKPVVSKQTVNPTTRPSTAKPTNKPTTSTPVLSRRPILTKSPVPPIYREHLRPSAQPTVISLPTPSPTVRVFLKHYTRPTGMPTLRPFSTYKRPSPKPTAKPSGPSNSPTRRRPMTNQPSEQPTVYTTPPPSRRTRRPSLEPTKRSRRPSSTPTRNMYKRPTVRPTRGRPTEQPTNEPTNIPTRRRRLPTETPTRRRRVLTDQPTYYFLETDQPTFYFLETDQPTITATDTDQPTYIY